LRRVTATVNEQDCWRAIARDLEAGAANDDAVRTQPSPFHRLPFHGAQMARSPDERT
jgi:hypothetical protein